MNPSMLGGRGLSPLDLPLRSMSFIFLSDTGFVCVEVRLDRIKRNHYDHFKIPYHHEYGSDKFPIPTAPLAIT